jgi:hypothetical protein
MTMGKYFSLIVVILIFVSTKIFAFSDIGTHPDITKKAAEESTLKTSNYLKDNLGFKNGLGEIILSKKTIQILLTDGSQTEDSGILNPGWINLKKYKICERGLNHFFDPTKYVNDLNAGLSDIDSGFSNPIWATGPTYSAFTPIEEAPHEEAQWSNKKNEYSWTRAREAFLAALLAKDDTERNRLFTRTFRSVGQVVHLIQDMAVPAHVRNDMKGHILA